MAAWIACALCALVIVKPQEFLPGISRLPILHIAFVVAAVFALRDILYRRVRPSLAPQLLFVMGFFGWASIITALRSGTSLLAQANGFVILLTLCLVVSVGCASRRGVVLFAATMAILGAGVCLVAVVQSQSPYSCFLAAKEDWEGRGELTPDGRPCVSVADCYMGARVPDGNYRCEKKGPLATATIGGRVRYRGSLADPNELSLWLCMVLPLATALFEGRLSHGRSRPVLVGSSRGEAHVVETLPPALSNGLLETVTTVFRAVPALAFAALVALVVVLSQSRTGLLSFLLVAGILVIRRLGSFGVVVGCLTVPALALIGGRRGEEAEESSHERAEILREAFEMIRNTRGLGLGAGRFPDESTFGLTAHNSYILAIAETGVVGYLLFGFALYASLKVPLCIWFKEGLTDSRVTVMARALTISMCGALLGLLFLSWTYKDILYMTMGASAALYSAALSVDPKFRVRITGREFVCVSAVLLGLLFAIYLYTRFVQAR